MIVFLTKMTAKNSVARRTKTSSKILKLAQMLQEPELYFSGVEPGPPLLPRSTLIFGRQHASDLTDPPEQHHRFVGIIALRGNGTVYIDEKLHYLSAGMALLIFPFQSHCYLDVDPRIQWVFIGFEHPEDERLQRLRDYGPIELGELGLQNLLKVFEQWNLPDQLDQLPLHLGILLHFLSEKAKSQPRPYNKNISTPGEALIARINLFVTKNISRPFTLSELSRHMGLSPSHLRDRFRHYTGRSLGHHIRDIRFQHACNLLHNGQDSIGEIASLCGFDSLFSFSRAFRHSMGLSPSAYRSRHVKQP